jgi:hypothetical protein
MTQTTLLNSSDYTIQTANGKSKLDINIDGLTYKVNNLLLNEYKDSSTPNYTYESKLVAISKDLDENNNLTFNLAWKNTSANANGEIYNTNWTFTKLSRDTSTTQSGNVIVYIDQTMSAGSKAAPFENLFNSDLNKDGTVGPKSLTTANTDTIGIQLARDADGSVYIQDGTKNIFVHDGLNQNTNTFENVGNSWGDARNGGGNESKIQVVSKGNPIVWANANLKPEMAASFAQIFPGIKASDNTDGFWALKKDYSWNISNGVKTSSDPNWTLYKISKDGDVSTQVGSYSPLNATNNVSASWLEGYFGQDLNGDGTTGPKLTWKQKSTSNNALVSSATTSDPQIATDADGNAFLVFSATGASDLADLSTNQVVQIQNSSGENLKLEQKNSNAYQEIVKLVKSGNDYLLYVRNVDEYIPMGASATTTVTRDWAEYKLNFTTTNNTVTQVKADFSKGSIKTISSEEVSLNVDINGDGTIGKGSAATIANAFDTTGDVLGRDKEGTLYILSPNSNSTGYDSLSLSDNHNIENTNSFSQKTAVAVAKATSDNLPTGFTAGNFYILTKTLSQNSNPSWQIEEFSSAGAYKGSRYISYDEKMSKYEALFGQDLNEDSQITTASNPIRPNVIATDNLNLTGVPQNGVVAARDGDGQIYVADATFSLSGQTYTASLSDVSPVMHSWGGSNVFNEHTYVYSDRTETKKVVAAERKDSSSSDYLVAVKTNNTYTNSNTAATDSWEIYTLKTVAAYQAATGTSTPGSYTSPAMTGVYAMPLGSNVPNNALVVYGNSEQPSSIAAYESRFGQDLDRDGRIGIDAASLTPLATDTYGAQLARDSRGALLIKQTINGAVTAKGINSNMGSLEYNNGADNYKTAIAVEAKMTGGTVEYYQLLLKSVNSYMTPGMTYASPGSTGSNTPTIRWDILKLDSTGKVMQGSYDNTQGRWIDPNQTNLNSLSDTDERFFNQDLNGDGKVGINVAKLTFSALDTFGTRLARDSSSGMYLVLGSGDSATAKSIRTNGMMLEYDYSGMAMGNVNKKEAVAVEAIRDGSNNITGYRLAMKQTNGNWDGTQTYSWDILQLDKEGLVTNGGMVNGIWQDNTVWGAKSIAPYESLFQDDLNQDGITGIDISTLKTLDTDTTGAKLARDSQKSLYITNGAATPIALPNSSWMEYDHSSPGSQYSNKREAVAIEAILDSTNTITGYKLALRQTDTYNGVETIRWEIQTLDRNGRQTYGANGSAAAMTGSSTWTNSISPYEYDFRQDLNGDGVIGVDVSTLSTATSDDVGTKLARDTAKSLFLIEDVKKPLPIGNSTWLEYENNWGTGYNKSEAFAVEAIRTNGAVSGYKLAVKRTNAWDNNTNVSWDVLELDTNGMVTYGTMKNQQWVNTSLYGVKSLNPYEDWFKQDFNGDGVVGLRFDETAFQAISTDNTGLRIYHDKDKALYMVDKSLSPTKLTPVGNASWLEYSNSWGETSYNKAEAYAVEAITNSGGTVTGYKLAIKQTNSMGLGSTPDINWQILSLDAEGNVSWNMGSNVWTRKTSLVEAAVNQDIDNDGVIGVSTDNLTLVSKLDQADSVYLMKDKDNGIYINDANKLIALTDSFGNSPSLEYSNNWTNSSSVADLVGVAKTSTGYRLALKTTNTRDANEVVSWQFHTVSADGILDWSKTANTRDPVKFETLFKQDFSGNGTVDASKALSLTPTSTDSGTVHLAYDASTKISYIVDDSINGSAGITTIVDSTGSSPSFDFTRPGYSSAAYAVNKLSDETYALAVLKTVSGWSGEDTQNWEVYIIGKRDSTGEAVLDWSKTQFLSDIKDVETALNKDTIFDSDSEIGFGIEEPIKVSGDQGSVYAGVDPISKSVYILKDGASNIAVTDESGKKVKFNKSSTWDTNSSFTAEVVGATSTGSGDSLAYKLAIKETTVIDGGEPEAEWKIYTLNASGKLNSTPVITKSMATFESIFGQDLNGDGNSNGVDGLTTTSLSTDQDVQLDDDGAIYLAIEDVLTPILNNDLGAPDLNFSELFASATVSSQVIAAETQEDDSILIAVQNTITTEDGSTQLLKILTAHLNSDGEYATIDMNETVTTRDLSAYNTQFGQDLSLLISQSVL